MKLLKKSEVVHFFFILSLCSVFAGHANREKSCARRAAHIACYSAHTTGSAILFMGGILAAMVTPSPREQLPQTVIAITSTMLLTLGIHGMYQGLRNLCCESQEGAGQSGGDQSEQQDDEQQ